ncbi:MAG: YaiO family outer membrane beta-barrel protein [Acidobacteriota bacterium]|nr:YaiO family outer membrane beta-barrel protein [Acidobacteriota bacterium]
MFRPLLVLVFLAAAIPSLAQETVIVRARAAASDGRRPDAIAMLEAHLATSPRDADARLVYGLILSWEGRYAEAREALEAVLAQAPGYVDARVALMNVAWWSGDVAEARALVKQIMTRNPGNEQARLVLQRLDARTRPWSAGAAYSFDAFSDQREPWQEVAVSLGRSTPVGSIIARGSQAERFGSSDRQFEVEIYPTFRAGTYAFVGVGFGVDQNLYPEYRIAFDLYHGLGHGFEVSGGFRRLQFSESTDIYVATLTKYLGNWMVTGKVYRVPDPATGGSWSYHGQLRRYFGSQGTSFIGGAYSHGLSREEPRGAGDLLRVDADTIRGQLQLDVSGRLQWSAAVGTSRQERALRSSLWQSSVSGGLSVRF